MKSLFGKNSTSMQHSKENAPKLQNTVHKKIMEMNTWRGTAYLEIVYIQEDAEQLCFTVPVPL